MEVDTKSPIMWGLILGTCAKSFWKSTPSSQILDHFWPIFWPVLREGLGKLERELPFWRKMPICEGESFWGRDLPFRAVEEVEKRRKTLCPQQICFKKPLFEVATVEILPGGREFWSLDFFHPHIVETRNQKNEQKNWTKNEERVEKHREMRVCSVGRVKIACRTACFRDRKGVFGGFWRFLAIFGKTGNLFRRGFSVFGKHREMRYNKNSASLSRFGAVSKSPILGENRWIFDVLAPEGRQEFHQNFGNPVCIGPNRSNLEKDFREKSV